MKKTGRYLSLVCIIVAGQISISTVHADASMPDFIKEAVGKAKECKRVYRKTGQNNQLAGECTTTCIQVYSLYKRNKQATSSQQVQVKRCALAYNRYKSPATAPAMDNKMTRMPATVEETVSRMKAMSPKGRVHPNKPCISGVDRIHRYKLNLEQAKPYWEGCVRSYQSRMKLKKMFGS